MHFYIQPVFNAISGAASS